MILLAFISGILVGGLIGFVVMAIVSVSKTGDDAELPPPQNTAIGVNPDAQ